MSIAGRSALAPQREAGRRRVEALLEAASSLIGERGYEATTMAAIATRAGARIGSLYRFFPNKEAIADALLGRYVAILDREYDAIEKRAAGLTATGLADLLIDLLPTIHPRVAALSALMEARPHPSDLRQRSRARAIAGIAAALSASAPDLTPDEIAAIAAVLVNNMKTMLAMTLGEAPSSAGAPEELRLMNRLYLADRLAPGRKRMKDRSAR